MMKRILLAAVILGLISCALPTRAPVSPTSWMVQPERSGQALKPRSDYILKIGAVAVTSPYDGKSLVYRLGDQRFEKDFYNVYTVLPSEMIANAEQQWLNQATIFSAAVGQNTSFFPDFTLQTIVSEFYGDYRTRPEAVVSVEFFLSVSTNGKGNPLIGSNRYTKRIELKNNTPEALVLGQQQALAEILKEYEAQLYQYAGNLPKPLGR
jgi:uncharacterized lipoprotein YmbA